MRVIKNARIYDFHNYFEDMFIVFDKKILEVGKMKDYRHFDCEEIDVKNALVMPGLINGHSHIYSTFARGMSVPFNPTNFKELLEQLWWKLDRNLTNEMTYYSGIVSGVEYLKNGVTTIIDHHASGEIKGSLNQLQKAVCNDVNLRGVFCFETSDRFNIDKCITENMNFINKYSNNHFTKGLFGMHASFTLSEETLNKISKVLHNNPIHIHVAESKYDQDHSQKEYNERVINRLNRHNLITKNSIITHGLYLDETELQIIKDKEAVIAVNVTSNMNNAVGLPNYQLFKENDIRVIIGNDGISQKMTSEYQALYYAMHHHSQSPIQFSFDDLISVINNTYEYASEILGVNLGNIEKDYQADLVVIPYNQPTPLNNENIFGHLFFGLFNNFMPQTVFVDGEKILDNYEVNAELKAKYKEAEKQAQKLWTKIEREG